MRARKKIRGRLFIRIVTSGKNPTLVKGTAVAAANVLKNMLHTDSWAVEVITDFPIGLAGLAPLPVREIVIPVGFSCPNRSLYRARALHYASCHGSSAQPADWIVHLDEDTHFDRQCIRHILWHIEKEDSAVESGQRLIPQIGQGIVLYGAGEFENVITTLADSIRVANNYGGFLIWRGCPSIYYGHCRRVFVESTYMLTILSRMHLTHFFSTYTRIHTHARTHARVHTHKLPPTHPPPFRRSLSTAIPSREATIWHQRIILGLPEFHRARNQL